MLSQLAFVICMVYGEVWPESEPRAGVRKRGGSGMWMMAPLIRGVLGPMLIGVLPAVGLAQQPGPPADRDYPTRLATWVEEHQTVDGQNRWQEFVEAATSLCASWEFFALAN